VITHQNSIFSFGHMRVQTSLYGCDIDECHAPKLGCVVRMGIYSILPHAKSGPNDHRKYAPPFILHSNFCHAPIFVEYVFMSARSFLVQSDWRKLCTIKIRIIWSNQSWPKLTVIFTKRILNSKCVTLMCQNHELYMLCAWSQNQRPNSNVWPPLQ